MFRTTCNAVLTAIALAALPLHAAEQPRVDLGVTHGRILHNGNGFHGGFREVVDTDRILAIRPSMVRRYGGQTIDVAAALKNQHGHQMEVIALLPGYNEGKGWQNEWWKWERHVKDIVDEMKQAKQQHGISYHYDIWNEGDADNTNAQFYVPQFNEFWARTAVMLRELDPGAKIAGPSFSYYGSSTREFLTYTDQYSKTHGVNARPDILNWHEFNDPMSIIEDKRNLEQWLVDNGMDQYIQHFSVNELLMSPFPHEAPRMFAGTEIARIDWAGSGYGGSRGPDRLNGLVKEDGKTPEGVWYSYKFYADMTGDVADVEHSSYVNAFATLDTEREHIQVLLGSHKDRDKLDDTLVELILDNVSETGFLPEAGRVLVEARYIDLYGRVDRMKSYTWEISYTDDTVVIPMNEQVFKASDYSGMTLTVTIPEPGTALLGGFVCLSGLVCRTRSGRATRGW